MANAYPTIVLDEFRIQQPINGTLFRRLGTTASFFAWQIRAAHIRFHRCRPERLNHFSEEFKVVPIDLSDENHRSKGTDIVHFGNDVLRGRHSKSSYNGIAVSTFEANKTRRITKVVRRRCRHGSDLIKNGPKDWSLAILVPTKRMTRLVSDVFRSRWEVCREFEHYAVVDMEAAILAAEIIAYGLQCHSTTFDTASSSL